MKKVFLYLTSFLISAITSLDVCAKDYRFTPSDIDGLKSLLQSKALQPGDNVLLADGEYNAPGLISFYGEGTLADTITLKAENPGKAIVSGPVRLCIVGDYLKVEGLTFNKAWAAGSHMIDFKDDNKNYARNCRFTNCVVDDCNNPKKPESGQLINGEKPATEYWIVMYGENNRVDHCYLANKRVGGLVLQIELVDGHHLNNHLIDHNLFGNRNPYGGNGAEIMRIGHSWSSQHESHTIVEDNVFLHCDGENEIISVKSCNNVLRRNLFFESRGGLVCRHGHYNVIEENTFVGNDIKGTCGIRIINQGHTVYRNYMTRLADFSLLVRMGVYERPTAETDIKAEPLTSYHRVENVDIAYNDFVDCPQINLCSGKGDKSPRNVRFANNRITGASNNLIFYNPEINLKGFYFLNNLYKFADNSSLPYKGFDVCDKISDFRDSSEKERVIKSTYDIGMAHYIPSQNDLKYILEKYN